MRRSRLLLLVLALSLGPVLAAHGQDDESPSLGDIARQSRQAKQQKDTHAGVSPGQNQNAGSPATTSTGSASQSGTGTAPANKPATNTQKNTKSTGASSSAPAKTVQTVKAAKRVITNEDMGATHIAVNSPSASKANSDAPPSSEQADNKNSPDNWSSQILSQKNAITTLKSDIDQLSASIQYAPGNCVEGCAEWNQHQQEKQQQVDGMKAQLEEMQKHLEEMQEAARKQGYGSSVYDPD